MRRTKLLLVMLLLLCLIMPFGSVNQAMAKEKKDYVNVSIFATIPYHIIKKGTSVNIETIGDANNKKITKFTYTSENKKVATVDKNGKIKALAKGEGRIVIESKDYPGEKAWIGITVTDRIIKIGGVKNCKAGNTYQLKASEKNVIWECDNSQSENAKASIDPKTGKLKIRNAGTIYVKCTSKDGKGLGAGYIHATGPMIELQNITLDPIIIDKDEHFVNATELFASGRIPEKVTVPYTDGKKKGNVELSIDWDLDFNQDYDDVGKHTIKGYLEAPDGYFLDQIVGEFIASDIRIDVDIKTKQTDIRKKIKSIEKLDKIKITKDIHLTSMWDIWDVIRDIKIKCKLVDGSIVELPIGHISYNEDEIDLYKVGTFKIKVGLGTVSGYDTVNDSANDTYYWDDFYTELKIEVVKAQTYKEEPITLDTIAPESWVYEFTSQSPIK